MVIIIVAIAFTYLGWRLWTRYGRSLRRASCCPSALPGQGEPGDGQGGGCSSGGCGH
ncbi:MAG: hypothetical protein HN353_03940 [Bdellovibrionales bacterium]|nr:hypothetical protein [Bdellovibrionales bacterium]MBT3525968.1 hypothetical protein [Bdellovibrionales bacterium]MBT7765755.1 hypothetical protein [Bdellovibrionales bacterium]